MERPDPLQLPDPAAYRDWLRERSTRELGRVGDLLAGLRDLDGSAAIEVMSAWNDVHVALQNVLSVASLLANVHPDEGVRAEAEELEREAQRLDTRIGLDRGLYDLLAAVDPAGLDTDGRRVLERSLRDFRRSGVDREEPVRERLRLLADRQTEVCQTFGKNIREGVGRIRVHADRLAGLPDDFLADRAVGDDGQVELTTEYPDYVPVMTFAADRALRLEMLTAFLNRAWPENDGVLRELLHLRRETADVLGYPDWPSYDAEVKMIGSGAAVPAFIDQVAERAAAPAGRDYAVLLERVQRDRPDVTVVDGADKSYYSELVRRERFEVDAQEVRRYFDFTRVRRGLLDVTGRLFGLEYVEVPDAARWDAEVTVHDVVDATSGERLGRIYLDLHPRAGKYSHAAQFSLVPGVRGRQLPEGVLVCNFPRGLMDHGSVVTLFHEFGHLVHHVLGGWQDWVRFSGVATEWDFVEAPSQMLEEWAWDHEVLASFAVNADGRGIPGALVERMRTAEEFGKGFHARTQMFYAAVSYCFHRDVPGDLGTAVRELQTRYDLFAGVPGTHFHDSFGHLGGYGSAYYTYMWSLVIAKDLFSAFDGEDLFAAEVARRYRDRVLVPGGSRDAAELVRDFLGRPYSFDAFDAWLSG